MDRACVCRWTLLVVVLAASYAALYHLDTIMIAASRVHGERFTIFDLELAGRDIDRVLSAWTPATPSAPDGVAAARTSLWLDFAFIAAYVTLLRWIARSLGGGRQGIVLRVLAAVPLVAGALDVIENVALLAVLSSWSSVAASGAAMPLVAAAAAKTKFMLLIAWAVVAVATSRILPYLFLARVPLLGLVTIAGVLPYLMPSSPLLGNLRWLDSRWQISLVGFVLGITSLACVSTAVLAIRYAPLRFGVRPLLSPPDRDVPHRWSVSIALVAAAPLAWSIDFDDVADRHLVAFGYAAIGIVAGCALIAGAQRRLEVWRRKHAPALPRADWSGIDGRCFGGYRVPRSAAANDASPPAERRTNFWGWTCDRFHDLLPGHLAAAVSFAILLALFIVAATSFAPGEARSDQLPILVDLLFIVAIAVSLLSGAAFLLDRHRVPLLLVVLAWTWGLGTLTGSTHYFLVKSGAAPTFRPPHPDDVAGRTVDRVGAATGATERDRLIVVCAAGGGIQAAGWTAKVLTELDAAEALRFADRLAFVSGVSGGSVGSMYYLEALRRKGRRLSPPDRGHVVDAAMASSLNAVGWALAFKDLRRPLGLWVDRDMDRSLAMEQVWRRSLDVAPDDTSDTRLDATLAQWTEAVATGAMPGVCFNATLGGVGSHPSKGRRLLLSTVDLGSAFDREGGTSTVFFDVYRRGDDGAPYDVAVTTAARLSATFPYVTPMSRAGESRPDGVHDVGPSHYVGDGGYFDNLGFVTALEFVARARAARPKLDVAVVVIRSFPDVEKMPRTSKTAGWSNALVGPLDLLLATWHTTQVERMDVEREMLDRGVPLFSFVFEGDDERVPPLSWHLSKAQRKAIGRGFGAKNAAELDALRRWVATGTR